MTDSMVEMVARALVRLRNLDPDIPLPEGGHLWRVFVQDARAAILAMREPQKGAALNSAIASALHGNADFEALWRDQIDAALKEPSP